MYSHLPHLPVSPPASVFSNSLPLSAFCIYKPFRPFRFSASEKSIQVKIFWIPKQKSKITLCYWLGRMMSGNRVGRRAWNILRLALLWERKGGELRRRLMMELRLVPKFMKNIGNSRHDSIHYGEHELSFDDTPIFHVKMHRPGSMRFKMPHIPCINPEVDFDYDFELGGGDGVAAGDEEEEARKSFLLGGEEDDCSCGGCEEAEEIDVKAEEFIAKFYAQMKLQRQISYLQYKEMLNRGTS